MINDLVIGSMTKKIKLFLFTTDLDFALKNQAAGIDSVIVDWETKGKNKRQNGFDTEINQDTPEDVRKLSQVLTIPVTVRINRFSKESPNEISLALDNGAEIIMLPMAKSADEVEKFLKIINKRAQTIIQIETEELVKNLEVFSKLNWDYAYIGLNDLMISRNGKFIWEAVLDKTVERICSKLKGRKYGFGGITIVDGGKPLSFRLLLNEYTRLDCSLCFLRRTYKREIMNKNIQKEVQMIKELIQTSFAREANEVQVDHQILMRSIKTIYKDML